MGDRLGNNFDPEQLSKIYMTVVEGFLRSEFARMSTDKPDEAPSSTATTTRTVMPNKVVSEGENEVWNSSSSPKFFSNTIPLERIEPQISASSIYHDQIGKPDPPSHRGHENSSIVSRFQQNCPPFGNSSSYRHQSSAAIPHIDQTEPLPDMSSFHSYNEPSIAIFSEDQSSPVEPTRTSANIFHEPSTVRRQPSKLLSPQGSDHQYPTFSTMLTRAPLQFYEPRLQLNNPFESELGFHTDKKPFKCEQCDRKFAFRWELKNHYYIHTGQKSFPCDKCDEKFRSGAQFAKHYHLVHAGEKRSSCDTSYM